jgi:membrane-anchored mycosin MYCP
MQRRRLGNFALAFLLTVGPVSEVSASALTPPKGACQQPPTPGGSVSGIPWAQSWLGFQRAWPFSTGAGVTVAVIDSGSDTDQPQLSKPGHVLTGFDFLRRQVGADFDCIGHGTAVASIIGATPRKGIAFTGVAPGVRILPERVTDDDDPTGSNQNNSVGPAVFAESIRYAVDNGAKVINLSLTINNQPVVAKAIMYAEQHDVVVVAAVGNQHAQDQGGNTNSQAPDPPAYPAAYPGVVGVGAIQPGGSVGDESQRGSYVDLVAPGNAITAPSAVRGFSNALSGTSFATPYVAGAAALVRAKYPNLNARQVVQRLLQTADPAPGNVPDPAYGYGVVDPYRAVTESFDEANPAAQQVAPTLPKPDYTAALHHAAAEQRATHADNTVLLLAGAGAGAALLFAIFAQGRRRRWVPTRVE